MNQQTNAIINRNPKNSKQIRIWGGGGRGGLNGNFESPGREEKGEREREKTPHAPDDPTRVGGFLQVFRF